MRIIFSIFVFGVLSSSAMAGEAVRKAAVRPRIRMRETPFLLAELLSGAGIAGAGVFTCIAGLETTVGVEIARVTVVAA